MELLRVFLAKCRALFRRNVVADEIRDEMQFHVEMRAEELARRGVAPDAAARAASKRFGNRAVMQDRGYDVRGAGFIESVAQDVRFGLRMLIRERSFSVVAVLTLALAIGASTALFSVIDAALLRPLPYPEPDRLVEVHVREREPSGELTFAKTPSFKDAEAWSTSNTAFTFVGQARAGGTGGPRVVDTGQAERATVGLASPDFFKVFGARPIVGRDFAPEETYGPPTNVALIGHAFWRSRFGQDRSAVGRTIRVDRDTLTIVGILPQGFYPETAVWRPLRNPYPVMFAMRATGVPMYARLRPGLAIAQASREATNEARRLASAAGDSADFEVEIRSLHGDIVARYGATFRLLNSAVAAILVIACINVCGLLLGRGASRQPELAIRASIGAGRSRLVRQLLTESVVLAAVGGTLGVGMAWLLLDALVAILPLHLPDNSIPSMNLTVLAFAATLSILTSVFFGLLPALRVSHVRLGGQLAHAGRQSGRSLSRRGGQVLVATEVALAITLLTGTGLLIRSLSKALAIDVGFEPGAFVTMEVFPLDPDPAAQRAYFDRLLERIRTIPGVAAAGTVDRLALGNAGSYTDAVAGGIEVTASVKQISPGYIEALGLRAVRGRLLTSADQMNVSVLSQLGAQRLFPDSEAVGRVFEIHDRTYTVIGVVRDIRSRYLFRDDTRPDVYLPFDETFFSSGRETAPFVVVRPSYRVTGLADELRKTAQEAGGRVAVERIRSGRDWLGDYVSEQRRRTVLIGLLSALGLTLSLIGIFGVTAYSVARRTQEIGVRMAFGARPRQVVGRIVGDAAWPMVLGIAIGLTGAYFATRVLESFLYETTTSDPATFLSMTALMAATAIVAAWIPARRAARVDPVAALRAE